MGCSFAQRAAKSPWRTSQLQQQELTRALAQYRVPDTKRSVFELTITVIPFFALWGAAWFALSLSIWFTVLLAILNAAFLVRIFIIMHDCGHGSFFRSRNVCNWTGRVLGVLALTPYDVWRQSHAIHHASTGNLDRRGMGDIPTLTIEEYLKRNWFGRAAYRLIRNPFILFCIVPVYTFVFQNRLPFGFMRSGWLYWASAMGTNAAIAVVLALIFWTGGLDVLVFVFLPTMIVAASIGIWLFYIQHQFEHTTWEREEVWNLQNAAFYGCSHYALPGILRWFSANIGVHHVHHLASRIPYYRLNEVLRDHSELEDCQRITLFESLHCARLHLWDEERQRLLTFSEALSKANPNKSLV
ncbi:fatty acid desaturase [Ruegeria atlantica]|uniref:fatty acid desaturase n=1 Tax=Ruegeria atlantica TaxID=81569 RepID=UPI00147EB1EA|nr:fatty acid desaturase [Ruegeria atlantica]